MLSDGLPRKVVPSPSAPPAVSHDLHKNPRPPRNWSNLNLKEIGAASHKAPPLKAQRRGRRCCKRRRKRVPPGCLSLKFSHGGSMTAQNTYNCFQGKFPVLLSQADEHRRSQQPNPQLCSEQNSERLEDNGPGHGERGRRCQDRHTQWQVTFSQPHDPLERRLVREHRHRRLFRKKKTCLPR